MDSPQIPPPPNNPTPGSPPAEPGAGDTPAEPRAAGTAGEQDEADAVGGQGRPDEPGVGDPADGPDGSRAAGTPVGPRATGTAGEQAAPGAPGAPGGPGAAGGPGVGGGSGEQGAGFWSVEQPPPWGVPTQGQQQPPGYPPQDAPNYGQQQPPAQPQPYGQPPYAAQPPYPQPYGQPPYAPQPGQPPYGQPGQPPYGQPGQPQYGQPPYGQPGQSQYGVPQYGQPPYGVPQYGQVQFGVPRPVEPRIVPPPPGEPFHRLARTAKNRWWRPLAGTALLVVIALFLTISVLIVWEVVHRLIAGDFTSPEGNSIFPNTTEDLSAQLVMLGILTPAVLLVVWVVQRRPAWSVASVQNRLRLRWLGICCLPAIGYLALSYGLGLATDALFPNADTDTSDSGSWVGLSSFIVPALLILLLVPFQSAAEEFVFRGWVVQAVGSYGPDGNNVFKRILRSPWPAMVISSAAFVSAHGYTGWAMADIFLFAMTVSWLAVRTGGIEAGIALHTMNNLFAFLLPAAMGQLDGWSNQGGAPWTLLVSDIPCLIFYALAVRWLAKRNKIATVSGQPAGQLAG